jgi:hypothetical protein
MQHEPVLPARIIPKPCRRDELRSLSRNPPEDGTVFAFPFEANRNATSTDQRENIREIRAS